MFAPAAIENCQKVEYDPDSIIPDCKVSIGVDPSFGSKFGIVATRFVNSNKCKQVLEFLNRCAYGFDIILGGL